MPVSLTLLRAVGGHRGADFPQGVAAPWPPLKTAPACNATHGMAVAILSVCPSV